MNNYQSDNELLNAFKKGNNSAIAELFKRYSKLIFGVCMNYLKNRSDADDAVMDIFEKVYKKLPESDVKSFKNWLFFVTKNHCLNRLRDQIKTVGFENFNEFQAEFMEMEEDSGLLKELQLEALSTAINNLKPEQRNCIILFFLKGKSYNEISEALQLELKAVKSRIQNGKRNLKLQIEKQ